MALRTFRSNAWLSRRRRAMLEAAEQTVEAATGAAIRQFLRRARAEVTEDSLTAAASDFRRSLRLFELGEARGWWTDALNEHVTDAVRTVWRTGYFDTRDGELVASSLQAAEDYVANVVDRLSRTATPTIPEQAFDRVRVALSDEMARGAPIRDMSQRLAAELDWDQPARYWRGRLSELDGQVDRILDPLGPPGSPAREAARANDPQVRELQRLRAEARQQIDRVQSTWETRAERIARTETTGAWNGAAEQAYVDEGAGVRTWLCVTGDTSVVADDVRAVARRRYVGPVVDLATASGRTLTLTPEHPVMAGGKWVSARDLNVGDDLLVVPAADPVRTPDVEELPATIGEIVDTAMDAHPVEVWPVGVSMDLDADLLVLDRHVEVVWADSMLAGQFVPGGRQRLVDGPLVVADALAEVFLLASRASGKPLVGHRSASSLGASGLSPSAGLLGEPASADDAGSRHVADGNVVLIEDAPDGRLRATDGAGDRPLAISRQVSLDHVVAVDIRSFRGHVYDLSTDGGWYAANGILVHNSTGDDRTRDTHLDAHGQCRPLDQPFDIGGVPLMFPGDPSGPPEEIINCRCATVGAADCGEADREYGFADEPIDEERERRDDDE